MPARFAYSWRLNPKQPTVVLLRCPKLLVSWKLSLQLTRERIRRAFCSVGVVSVVGDVYGRVDLFVQAFQRCGPQAQAVRGRALGQQGGQVRQALGVWVVGAAPIDHVLRDERERPGGRVVLRTVLEDRLLREELPGYLEYSHRVRHSLVPAGW